MSIVLAGCATMSPQIYSKRLQQRSANEPIEPSTHTLPQVIAEVEDLQARYATAVRELSEVQPAVSLALIGLSAFSLFKGIASPSTDAITAAAVLGSGAYVWGSTVISKPRQLVYLAGIEALSCAISAVEPFNKGEAWFGSEVNPADGTFRARIAGGSLSLDTLRRATELARRLGATETIAAKPAAALPNCALKNRPSCNVPAAATTDERRRLETACKAEQAVFDKRCQPRQASPQREIVPDPTVVALLEQAVREQSALARVLVAAQRTETAIEQAGPLLWERAVQIQVKVGAEVLKTEPDLSSVLGAVQGMRGAAGMISGSDIFKPPPPSGPGTSQGRERGVEMTTRTLSDVERQQLDALADAVAHAARARVDLALMVAGVDGQLAAARKNLAACEVKVPGVKLAVLPDDEEVRVAKGGSAVFYVSGGSGTPQGVAVAVAGSAGDLKRELDASGRLRFTYAVPESAAVGDTVRVQFTDGSGQAKHDVRIVVSEGEAVNKTAGNATPLSEMTADDLTKFGLPSDATTAQRVAAIGRCQKKNGLGETGEFDPRTQRAAQQGLCKP